MEELIKGDKANNLLRHLLYQKTPARCKWNILGISFFGMHSCEITVTVLDKNSTVRVDGLELPF
jgi:hypothetical protein